jgi:hypothetical protein
VIGVGLPIYVLQIGIRHTEPITTSLLVSLSPLFAFLMQLADGRLRPSVLTLVCIIGVVTMVGVGIAARGRQEFPRARRAGRDPTAPSNRPVEPERTKKIMKCANRRRVRGGPSAARGAEPVRRGFRPRALAVPPTPG